MISNNEHRATILVSTISLQELLRLPFVQIVEVPRDPAASRYEHAGKGLRRSDLDPNPIRQFANWFTAAIEAGIRDVNAMSLATADRDARPSVRIVLLKSFDQDGFVFFTNYESIKGKQLEANPYAALGFYWIELDRQIRISGKVEKTSREESQAYFHSRPVGSQLGAWASRQSEMRRWPARARCAHGGNDGALSVTSEFHCRRTGAVTDLSQTQWNFGRADPIVCTIAFVTRGWRTDRGKLIGSRREMTNDVNAKDERMTKFD